MEKILSITQVLLAVLLITSILLQQRGAALGGAFGGSGGVYRSRRGVEKLLFNFTILVAVLFILAVITDVIV